LSEPPPHVTVHVVLLTQPLQLPAIGHASVLQSTVCSLLPEQLRPPLAGAGLVHVRVCVSDPPPQVAVHAVLFAHSLQLPSIGHAAVLHATACWDDPKHVAPPLAGAGLVHVRVCESEPPPHVTVHVVLLTHSLQLPSTALWNVEVRNGNDCHSMNTAANIPGGSGHACVLHGTVCSELPGQLMPPFAGAGLMQVRVCVSEPPPHVTVHVVLLAHSLQLPSTVSYISSMRNRPAVSISQVAYIPGPSGHACVLHDTVCSELPGQLRPPLAGAGLVHVRVCVSDPPPQVVVHVVLVTQPLQLPSIGHAAVLQAAVCWDVPRHVAPPLAGTGLVHVRVCEREPPPHVAVHVVVVVQDDHCPSPEWA
jgi:hypothetical protein